MTTAPHGPVPQFWQAWLMRLVNVAMRLLLQLPFDTPLGNRLILVMHVGRKTGKVYRQPVSYIRGGATLLSPAGGRWQRNLHPDQPVRIRLHGRDRLVLPEVIGEVAEVERILRAMQASNRRVTAFVPLTDARGQIDRGLVEEAVARGFRLVRWQFADASGATSPRPAAGRWR